VWTKGSSQHDKCQVGNMLWTENSSQHDKCQVGNMHSYSLDLVHSGSSFIGNHSIIMSFDG
jgi:hypothetical protein